MEIYQTLLLGNPAACRGHKTDGVSPRGVAVHYSTGGRIGSSSLWPTTGFGSRGRYNLITSD